MGLHELLRNREPKPCAVLPRHALKRLEEIGARLLRHAGSSVGDLDDGDRPFALRGDGDLARARLLAFQGLDGIAAKIAEHPVKLLAVGMDLEILLHLDLPSDEAWARPAHA